MVILVTGSSGFVGRHVVPNLLADGHQLICYGRRSFGLPSACRFIAGDIYKQEGFDEIPWSEIEGVIHLASAGVKASSRSGNECLRVNVAGFIGLLDRLRTHGKRVRRVVITPTFYERCIQDNPALLDNPYIATKHMATQIFQMWAKTFSGQVSLATLFQAYGPGDDSGNVLSYVASTLKKGQTPRLGSGVGLRDWIYIDDVASALAILFKCPEKEGIHTHDLGSGELLSIRFMAEQVATAMGKSIEDLEFDASRDRPDGGLGLKATYSLFGWEPKTKVSEGILKLIKS